MDFSTKIGVNQVHVAYCIRKVFAYNCFYYLVTELDGITTM